MLTIFSTPKPFRGHINVIQRNALRSWQLLHPEVEILIFGDDEGAAEVCEEFHIRHFPSVRRSAHGTKYLASIYDQAQQSARHDILCHVNCDILLFSDFIRALEMVSSSASSFLMAGCRWDVDIRNPLNFADAHWNLKIRDLAIQSNRRRPPQWIDYFAFRRGLYLNKIPPFVIGRPGWDNWLLWFALSSGVPLVDASKAVLAVHQNHDYGYHPDGEKGVWEGEEAQENYALLDGYRKFRTLRDATHWLSPAGLRPNYRRYFHRAKQEWIARLHSAWFRALDLTRPLRHRLGLRERRKAQA